ncbi:hypothetical protein HQ571_06905 [Candidatus Kuenenbacteria bacterium]|nr:hypothetical protein [Candidatus Kuenenbacteria bacterium]
MEGHVYTPGLRTFVTDVPNPTSEAACFCEETRKAIWSLPTASWIPGTNGHKERVARLNTALEKCRQLAENDFVGEDVVVLATTLIQSLESFKAKACESIDEAKATYEVACAEVREEHKTTDDERRIEIFRYVTRVKTAADKKAQDVYNVARQEHLSNEVLKGAVELLDRRRLELIQS